MKSFPEETALGPVQILTFVVAFMVMAITVYALGAVIDLTQHHGPWFFLVVDAATAVLAICGWFLLRAANRCREELDPPARLEDDATPEERLAHNQKMERYRADRDALNDDAAIAKLLIIISLGVGLLILACGLWAMSHPASPPDADVE
jgi:hypothetical protein